MTTVDRLPVHTQFVPIGARLWMVVPFTLGVGGAFTAFVNEQRATSRIFTVMTSIIPWAGWGVLYGVVAIASIVCAATAAWWAYRLANLAAFVGSFAVMFSALWARFIAESPGLPGITLGILVALTFTFAFAIGTGVRVTIIQSRTKLAEQINR